MGGGTWSRTWKIALPVVVGAALGWWLLQPRPDARELIEELVLKAEHGVETKSVDEVMDCLAPDYVTQNDISRQDIWRLAMQWARSPIQADVVIQDNEITVTGQQATGHFHVQVGLEEEGRYRSPITVFLTVEFERQRRGLRKVWLVKSVSGFDLDAFTEEFV